MKASRPPTASLYPGAIALAAAAVIVAVDGWRTALLALLASGAVAATRVRYSGAAAAALLAVTALWVSRGNGIG